MRETKLRSRVVELLKPLNAFAVENTAHDGTPDICTTIGWIELKIAKWPRQTAGRIDLEIRNSQLIWFRRWTSHGGKAWLLTKLDKQWLLHDGVWVWQNLPQASAIFFYENALAIWGILDIREILSVLIHNHAQQTIKREFGRTEQ